MLIRWTANSIAALLLLTGLWWLLQLQTIQSPEQALQIRELSSLTLPPPPPPPPARQLPPQQSVAANLQLSSIVAGVKLQVTELDVSLPELTSPIAISKAPLVSALSFDTEALVAAITTFSLDELDEIPRLMTPISVRLPAVIRQQGVRQAQLRLHVIIHESGKAELVAVDQAQYPELEALVPRIMQQARFTSPRREGNKVKAEFLWPIKVSA